MHEITVRLDDREFDLLYSTTAKALGVEHPSPEMLEDFCRLSVMANIHVARIASAHLERMLAHAEEQERGGL